MAGCKEFSKAPASMNRLYVHIYICIYIYVNTSIFVCIYIYTHIDIDKYVQAYMGV